MNRVVITGIGALTPIGNDLQTISDSLFTGRSGIRWIEEFNTVHGVVDYDFSQSMTQSELSSTDRFTRMCWSSYDKAKKDDEQFVPQGIYAGLGFGGGARTIEESYDAISKGKKLSPFTLMRAIPSAAVNFITMKEQIKGPSITFTTACSSSSIALGEAYKLIRNGELDRMAVVGVESLNTQFNASSWRAIGAINEQRNESDRSVRPFSQNRKGTAVSEGAITFFIENLETALKRKAKIYCEIVCYSTATGTETFSKPLMEAQVDVITKALSQIDPSTVTYINAHGTGTPVGDLIELQSIEHVFGSLTPNIPISSTKSLTGHLLGAAGSIESLSCIISLIHNKTIPNWNMNIKDSLISPNIWIPTISEHKDMDVALNNSFAFGGTNAVIGLKKWK